MLFLKASYPSFVFFVRSGMFHQFRGQYGSRWLYIRSFYHFPFVTRCVIYGTYLSVLGIKRNWYFARTFIFAIQPFLKSFLSINFVRFWFVLTVCSENNFRAIYQKLAKKYLKN